MWHKSTIRASHRRHRRWLVCSLAGGMAAGLAVGVSWVAGTAARAQQALETPAPAIETAPAGLAENKIAVFSGLDKITAQISRLEARIGEPVQFGTLQIVVRTCNKRPPEETPETTAFVEVTERRNGSAVAEPLFTGWMFASSPGLNALEHPVYDVWLINCKTASAGASPASR